MEPFRIISTILALLSLLLLLLALGSNYWLLDDRISFGLWKICSPAVCTELTPVFAYVDPTRAFLFLGMIAGGASSTTLLASFFRSHLGPVPLALVTAVSSFSAGLCAMIAMAVFTAESANYRTQNNFALGWSFGLGWASFPLFLLAGTVAMFIPKDAAS